MKLLNRIIENSPQVVQLVKAVATCASALEKLAVNMAIIAHNQSVHHQMIGQMWAVHEAIVKRASQSGIDMSIPGIDKADDPDKDKPN